MIVESFQIHAGNGTTLFCNSWQPTSPPKAAVFIVHGLGEHLGRYEEMAISFVEKGLAVFAFDHRGHGQSSGKKGHAPSVAQLIEDTEFALMKCRSIFLDIPIFIYGHSMGGQVASSFLKKIKSKELSGAIISSAWFKLATPPPAWQIAIIRGVKKLLPGVTLSNGLDPNHISSIPDEVKKYQDDELNHDRISFSLFNSLYSNGLKLLAEDKKAKVPVLICHGDADQITSFDGSKQYAENLGEKAAFHNCHDAYHEPHHDKDKQEVMTFYADWILENIKQA